MDYLAPFIIVVAAFMLFWRLLNAETPKFQLPIQNDNKLQWAMAARMLGLSYDNDEITGSLQGFEVVVSTAYNHPTTNIVVKGGGKIDSELMLYNEASWAGAALGLGREDVQTSDPPFDAEVLICGGQGRALAALNHKARDVVQKFVKVGRVREGNVEIEVPEIIKGCQAIVTFVKQAVTIAEHLALPADAMVQALAENALTDPISDVRARNRECLIGVLCSQSRRAHYATMKGRHPVKDATLQRARTLLTSTDPELRLLCAMLVGGDAGFAVLEALARNTSAPEQVRVRTLLTLTTLYPWEKVGPIMASLLSIATPEGVLISAVVAIGVERDSKRVGEVCALAASASDKLACEIARTLERLGESSAEATLVEFLSRDASDVRLAAVQALRYVGTVRAVEPLLRVDKGRGSAELKIAIRGAIGGIQGRLGSVEAGRLSLVEPEDRAGGLSIAHEKGALSLASRDAGSKK